MTLEQLEALMNWSRAAARRDMMWILARKGLEHPYALDTCEHHMREKQAALYAAFDLEPRNQDNRP